MNKSLHDARKLCLIFSDQLSESLSSLQALNKDDVVLMCELMEELTNIPHHPKKIAFICATMRHFASELSKKGFTVHYIALDDPQNTQTFESEVARALKETGAKKLLLTEPSEYKLLTRCKNWGGDLSVEVEILPDTRFLSSCSEFKEWATGRKELRMEYFYRMMRKKHDILIESDGEPTNGQWNFDKENRKAPPAELKSPKRISHKKDQITKEVIELVKKRFSNHFGTLEPFYYAINREQALIELNHFIIHLLPYFGDYQDAMVKGEPYLYHSLISSYLNAGLLLPLEICEMAENAYRMNKAPINAVEGFIRQILGWREYVRGIYSLYMPQYGEMNYFEAKEPLPQFYWGGKTKMACVAEAVCHTRDHAYSHHIQRLMITGNFALLAALDVKEVQDWYLAVYSDAYEWIEMPNTLGMALFGDGGIMASKPYAASGKYINKMSNFCKNCAYNPEKTVEKNGCPFNALYWDFMARNQAKLKHNHRLPFVYSTWEKFGTEKQEAIRVKANEIIKAMREGEL